MANLMKRFVRDESGAALIEYTVLLGILIAGVVVTIGTVGTTVSTKWSGFSDSFK